MVDNEPIIMAFPLRGEWLAPQTPGTKIPRHGTNRLGTRYAFEFIQVDWARWQMVENGVPTARDRIRFWPSHYG